MKPRNSKSTDELEADWLDRVWRCGVSTGWGIREMGDGSLDFLIAVQDEDEYALRQDALFQCWAEQCADINTFDASDDDRDGLNDTCDCEVLDPPADEERDRQCWVDRVPNPGGLPGQHVCRPGADSKSCAPYDDTERWMRDVVLGGLLQGDGVAADAVAAEIEFEFDDGLAPDCPEGAQCDASRSRRRGKDYERFLCNRLIRRTGGDCECGTHPSLVNRYPSYRTEEVCWDLPPDLPHRLGRQVCRPAGRLRYPDYLTRGEWHVAMGEAKCYDPVQVWNARDSWWWYRAVSFGPQLQSYMRKVLASRRGDGPRYSINYHFCSAAPRWAAQLMAAGYVMDAGGNHFHLYLNDSGGQRFIDKPICWASAAGLAEGVAATLYACFVPGEVAPEGVSPEWECTGAFYDHCEGSE